MSHNRYKMFFAAYKKSQQQGNPLSREEVVHQFTDGRTSSLKDLTDFELNELSRRMNRHNLTNASSQDEKANNLRRAIIAIFHEMGHPPEQAKAWAEIQGAKGIKKRFNNYTNQELMTLLIVARKVLTDFRKSLRKGLTNEKI